MNFVIKGTSFLSFVEFIEIFLQIIFIMFETKSNRTLNVIPVKN